MPPLGYRRLQAAALGLAALLTLGLSGLLSPRLAPRYTVTDLGVLPGDTESSATAINSGGVAVGFSQGTCKRACIFAGGNVMSLGALPGGSGSGAGGINSRGEVTGTAWLLTGNHAFLYSGGKMQDLGTLPGFRDSEGAGINDGGESTGNVTNLTGRAGLTPRHGFFYSHGRMIALGLLPGFTTSDGRSINAAGQVAGVCYSDSGRIRCAPFLYDTRRNSMTALPLPPPYRWGFAHHINGHGEVAGNISTMNRGVRAALWSGGKLTDLGIPPGFSGSTAQGLNDQGEAIGCCFRDYSPVEVFLRNHVSGDNALRLYLDRDTTRAFVYRQDKMQNLNELIPSSADWILEEARGINDRGQIVGQGLHHGQERGFLLTPR